MKKFWYIASTTSFILSLLMSIAGLEGRQTFHTGLLCLIVAKLS